MNDRQRKLSISDSTRSRPLWVLIWASSSGWRRELILLRTLSSLSLLVVLLSLISGCFSSEPSNKSVQKNFLNHSGEFEVLLKMMQEDVSKYDISFINAASHNNTLCGIRPVIHSCSPIQMDKWYEYQRLFENLGVISVSREKEPDKPNSYYFYTYYTSFLMDARMRGIVFTEDSSLYSISQKKQELFHIKDGWYSFVMIDN